MVNTTKSNNSYPALIAKSIHYVDVNITFENDGDWEINSKYNRNFTDHTGSTYYSDTKYLQYTFDKDTRVIKTTIEPEDPSFNNLHAFFYSQVNLPLGAEQWYRLDDIIVWYGMRASAAKDINLIHLEDNELMIEGNNYTGETYRGNITEYNVYSD
ncbi:MAG: hypothetical protein ACTSR8_01295 [Promethearchaeota archaeon]